jgi:hypothetical protein
MHWAFHYIGTPWVAGSHDCWAFFRRVQLEQFGRMIPPFDMTEFNSLACARAVATNPERGNWRPVDKPAEGDAVLLAHAHHPSHVGLWVDVDGGGVLHCLRGDGVVFQKVKNLKSSGWGHMEYYRHV